MAQILFLDTTLRDGEQTPGVSLRTEGKVRIARALDGLGVDVIEAGSACTSEGEREAIKAIVSEKLDAEVASFARILKSDIDLALDCGVDSVFLVAPTSDLHIKWKLKSTREAVLGKVTEHVEYCKAHGVKVDLCCEDGSRSDTEYLLKVLAAATSAKADRFTVADTVGILTPPKTEELFQKITAKARIPVGVHCHDDFGMGTANTVMAVKAGARVVDVTVNGLGERAGNTPLEEVAVALRLTSGHKFKLRIEGLNRISNLVEKLTGIPVPPNKAIVGENAFTHEAGIHVDGILKNPSTYEPIKPEIVGARRRFVLGKHVGLKSVRMILEESGYRLTEEQAKSVFDEVKSMGDKGKRVTSVDLDTIAHAVMGVKREKPIKLIELVATAGNKIVPSATVKLQIDGDTVTSMGSGDGPVDASLNAIKVAVKGVPFELKEYHVDAVSGGTDAVVRILVTLKSGGKLYTAEGAGTDIVLASVDAMINGLNAIMSKR